MLGISAVNVGGWESEKTWRFVQGYFFVLLFRLVEALRYDIYQQLGEIDRAGEA